MSFIRLLLCTLICSLLTSAPIARAGTCTGADDCTACSTCKYCKHCAILGGTCGVKKALDQATSESPQQTNQPQQPPTQQQKQQQETQPPLPKKLHPFRAAHPSQAPGEKQANYQVALLSLSDPAKLATLGERGANPRLKQIVYWLNQARLSGENPSHVIDATLQQNAYSPAHADLIKTNLLRNLKIGDELGFFTPQNSDLLRRGGAPLVMRGPYAGEIAHVDHIIPVSIAPEIGNDLANLELMPKTLNLRKSAKIGDRQKALAHGLNAAGVIDAKLLERIMTSKTAPPPPVDAL